MRIWSVLNWDARDEASADSPSVSEPKASDIGNPVTVRALDHSVGASPGSGCG